MSPPVLVIITAKNCGACENFKRYANAGGAVSKMVFETTGIKTIEIECVYGEPMSENVFPKRIRELVNFYPFILLANGDQWEAANKEKRKDVPISLIVFGAEVLPDGTASPGKREQVVLSDGTKKMLGRTPEDLSLWVEANLSAVGGKGNGGVLSRGLEAGSSRGEGGEGSSSCTRAVKKSHGPRR